MAFEHIEELKREYTDKYVVVDDTKPELRRFKNQTGQVRSVNMSGRALVEFDAYENIGWYDIEIDFLKVVDKPLPKKEPAKKEPAKKKPAAKVKSEDKPKPAGPAAGGTKMSVTDMLAAARGEKSGGAQPSAEAPAIEEPPTAEAKPATKSTPGMSVTEMLAAARAEKTAPKAAEDTATETPAAEPAAPAPAESTISEADQPATPNKDIPTDTAGILDYCRKTDS